MTDLTHHPAARLYPPLNEADYNSLEKSILKHGIQTPILTWRGQIIDGAHRHRIATELGLTDLPTIAAANRANPWEIALDANSDRRQLNESQRALIAATITTTTRGGKQPADKITASHAARLTATSERTITRAQATLAKGAPELLERIKDGTYTLADAAPLLTLPHPDQTRIVTEADRDPRTTLTQAHRQHTKQARTDQAWRTIAIHHTHLDATLEHLAANPTHTHPDGCWLIITQPLPDLPATINTMTNQPVHNRWQYTDIHLTCLHRTTPPTATAIYRRGNPPDLPQLGYVHATQPNLPQPLIQANEKTQPARLKSKLNPNPKTRKANP